MQAITLSVIMSAVFGVDEGGENRELLTRAHQRRRRVGQQPDRTWPGCMRSQRRGKAAPASFIEVRDALDEVVSR